MNLINLFITKEKKKEKKKKKSKCQQLELGEYIFKSNRNTEINQPFFSLKLQIRN